eukprot:c42266_g1_i1 orf=1-234(-)
MDTLQRGGLTIVPKKPCDNAGMLIWLWDLRYHAIRIYIHDKAVPEGEWALLTDSSPMTLETLGSFTKNLCSATFQIPP